MACELFLNVGHFDIEQAFVKSYLENNVRMRLPHDCGRLTGKGVRLNKKACTG